MQLKHHKQQSLTKHSIQIEPGQETFTGRNNEREYSKLYLIIILLGPLQKFADEHLCRAFTACYGLTRICLFLVFLTLCSNYRLSLLNAGSYSRYNHSASSLDFPGRCSCPSNSTPPVNKAGYLLYNGSLKKHPVLGLTFHTTSHEK